MRLPRMCRPSGWFGCRRHGPRRNWSPVETCRVASCGPPGVKMAATTASEASGCESGPSPAWLVSAHRPHPCRHPPVPWRVAKRAVTRHLRPTLLQQPILSCHAECLTGAGAPSERRRRGPRTCLRRPPCHSPPTRGSARFQVGAAVSAPPLGVRGPRAEHPLQHPRTPPRRHPLREGKAIGRRSA